MNNIYVVLTKTNTIVARSIRKATGATYSHASLAFNDWFSPMYSFARKYVSFPFIGTMVKEEIGTGVYGRYPLVPCCILRISVTQQQFIGVKTMTENMWLSRQYGYNYSGLIFNYIGICRHSNKRFFCSEFVYYVLQQNGVVDSCRLPSQIRPQDLLNIGQEVIYEGNLNDLRDTFSLGFTKYSSKNAL